MNVYPEFENLNLDQECFKLLSDYREFRSFSPKAYIQLKARLINAYFHKNNLKAAVLGVSGGVDSALALALMMVAKNQPGSPIEKILPVFLPVYNKSASNQSAARQKALDLCHAFGLDLVEINLTTTHSGLSSLIEQATNLEPNDWAQGQFVAHCRTPSLYYCATLLTANNLTAIIIGTTNKDEGAYLGYVGKASDGLVDLQIISDLHKSEVFSCAQELGVPSVILDSVPHGDLFDGRADVELFGAPYEFVELYHYYKQVHFLYPHVTQNSTFSTFAHNLEKLHKYNRHKYMSCSPAIHLDVIADISQYSTQETLRTNLDYAKSSYARGTLTAYEIQQGLEYWKSLRKPFIGVEFPVATDGQMHAKPLQMDFGCYSQLI